MSTSSTLGPSIHAVILAGGKGTRFWPASRAARPKQLLPIVSERTMVQETIARLSPLVAVENVWVVTGRAHADAVREQAPELSEGRIVVEPMGRNTAPAIGLAAHLIAAEDPSALMIVLPADHHIEDPAGFRATLANAVKLADGTSTLVTIGIDPTAPETGYGYIGRGEPLGQSGAYRVARFTEKPVLEVAQQFLDSGDYYWNAGMFVWSVATICRSMAEHMKATDDCLQTIVAAWGDDAVFERAYESIEGQSIDYGVMERATEVAVVPGSFGWNDIGSWSALGQLWPRDADGNALRGNTVVIDGHDNIVDAGDRTVALVGVEGLIVVDAGDAILVGRADRAQDVKRIVEELERRGRTDLL